MRARREEHLRHDRQGLLPDVRVRPALVRRLPRRRAGRRRADVLHRPALLVPVAQLRLREALGRGAAQPRRRRAVGERAAADELRDVALRALRQRDAAGRGDALRPQADGRRGAGRGHAAGAQCAQPRHLQADPARGEALRRSLPGPGDAARGAGRRPRGRARGRGPRRGGAPRARRRGRRSTARAPTGFRSRWTPARAGPPRSPSRRPTRAPACGCAPVPPTCPPISRRCSCPPSASRRATRSGWSRPPARRSPSRRARR